LDCSNRVEQSSFRTQRAGESPAAARADHITSRSNSMAGSVAGPLVPT
jgi:hypothetical protein